MSAFNGKTVVVTGFGKSERADLEQRLMAAGALVTHSVSSKTQVLVTGSKPGPDKVAKAHGAGAEVIDEATARARLGQ
jgi:DNA ligase (NAD+)